MVLSLALLYQDLFRTGIACAAELHAAGSLRFWHQVLPRVAQFLKNTVQICAFHEGSTENEVPLSDFLWKPSPSPPSPYRFLSDTSFGILRPIWVPYMEWKIHGEIKLKEQPAVGVKLLNLLCELSTV